jgi:hypothetical protein
MRWFVDVATLSGGAAGRSHKHTIEASSWQAALSQVRAARHDSGPLSSFSIEVLADGYRATHVQSRVRYTVNRAPDDAPLDAPSSTIATPPPSSASGVEPAPDSSPAATAANALRRSNRPAAPAPTATPSPQPPAAAPAPAPAPVAAPAPAPAAPPRPIAATPAAPVVEPSAPEPPPNADGVVIHRRGEEPGGKSPLTYRELAIHLDGATLDHAVEAARGHLAVVRAELDRANAPAGRLVQLAVFDHAWTGRPRKPPIVSLVWKDWKGDEPRISYPAPVSVAPPPNGHDPAVPIAPAPPSAPAPSSVGHPVPAPAWQVPASAPTAPAPVVATPAPAPAPVVVTPAPAPAPVVVTPAPVPAPAAPPPPSPAAKALAETQIAVAPPPPSPAAKALAETQIAVAPKSAKSFPDTQVEIAPPPIVAQQAAPAPAAVVVALAPPPPPAAPAVEIPIAIEAAPPPAAPAAPAVAPEEPKPAVAAAKAAPVPAPEPTPEAKPAAASAPLSTPAPASAPRPDDLTSELFEAMHDLHFLRDSIEGADFVLDLLKQKIPTVVALVHLYDINAKEYVIVRGRAPKEEVVGMRYKETIGLVGWAAKSGRGVLVRDTGTDHRWSRDRYEAAGHAPKTIAVVPVRHGQRNLGAIEVSDHLDGGPLTDDELHALSYVADQYGEYLDQRGVFLTKEAAQEHAKEAAKAAQRPKRR